MRPGLGCRAVAMAIAIATVGAAPSTYAAPTDVQIRIEGRSATLYEGPLRTSDAPVDGADGSGTHSCHAGDSPASTLAATGLPWAATWNADFQDFFLDRIGPDASDPQAVAYWSVLVDWRYAAGICRSQVPTGSEVLLAYGPGARMLRLTGPARVGVGESFAVSVRDGWIRQTTGLDGGPVEGATVGGATTGAGGQAILRFDTSGAKLLKATAPNAIRSNALLVCVGDERCEGSLPERPSTPLPEPPTSPLAIAVPAAGERYARGASTMLLLGRGAGDTTLRLGGKVGGRCIELASPTRIIPRPCSRQPRALPAARGDTHWSYRLRTRLAPGRYQLIATAGRRAARSRFSVAATPTSVRVARKRADHWLRHAQSRRGGFGPRPGAATTPLFTDWAAVALGRIDRRGAALRKALVQVRATPRQELATLERAALALMPSPVPQDDARLRRVQAAIAARQRPDGSWAGNASASAYAILALRGSTHRRQLRTGIGWLRTHARPLDADTIGAVLWALGRNAPRSLVTRLHSQQNADGGYPAQAGDPSNTQSTALAIVGLRATGSAPGDLRANTGISGLDYLRARQRPSGLLDYTPNDHRTPVWVTAQALLAFTRTVR